MKNIMEYKGYYGSVEYSDEDNIFFGELLFINDLITFEGDCVKSLKESFHYMVDNYLETCKRLGKEPNKPFSGSFNIRIGSELHKKVAILAEKENKSINKIVCEALEEYINNTLSLATVASLPAHKLLLKHKDKKIPCSLKNDYTNASAKDLLLAMQTLLKVLRGKTIA